MGIWQDDSVSGSIIKKIIIAGSEVASAETGDRVDLGLTARDGARIYLTSSPKIKIEPDFAIKRPPISLPPRQSFRAILPKIVPAKAPPLKLMVKAYSLAEARESLQAGTNLAFYNIFSPDFPAVNGDTENQKLGAYLPRIMSDDELSRAVALLKGKKPPAILTGNIGFLAYRVEFRVPVYLDYALNAFNDLDLLYFQRWDVTPVLSPELSLTEMTGLKNKNVVVFCHGDVVLVNTRVEITGKELADDKGSIFPVRKECGYWQILNSRPFGLFSDIHKLIEVGFSQFFIDQQNRGAYFAALYRRILENRTVGRRARRGYTSGHLYRPVD